MAQEYQFPDDLAALEDALRDLAPAPPRMNSGQTMFLAGQQAALRAQRTSWVWPACSACLALLCVTFAALLLQHREPRIVYVPVSSGQEKQHAEEQGDAAHRPVIVQDDEQPSRSTPISSQQATPSATHWLIGAVSQQQQEELLRQLLVAPSRNRSSDDQPQPSDRSDPVAVATIHSSDWPALLPDQSAGERFRALSSSLVPTPAGAFSSLTSLFSTKGS